VKTGIEYPPHPFISQLQNMKDYSNRSQTNCQYCENETAAFFCYDCALFYGRNCKPGHSKILAHKSHNIVPLESLESKGIERIPMCQNHPTMKVKWFCEPCNAAACGDCILTDHSDHKTVPLEQSSEGGASFECMKRSILAKVREVKSFLSFFPQPYLATY